MSDLIVKSAVQDATGDTRVSSDFYEALNGEVEELIEDAMKRSAANDRKTVEPRDL